MDYEVISEVSVTELDSMEFNIYFLRLNVEQKFNHDNRDSV